MRFKGTATINVNEHVVFQLTTEGERILNEHIKERLKENDGKLRELGYNEEFYLTQWRFGINQLAMPLWEVMNIFGSHCVVGSEIFMDCKLTFPINP